jgi:hypothetical protein
MNEFDPKDIVKKVLQLGLKSNLLKPIKMSKHGANRLISKCALCGNIKEIMVFRYGMCSKCYEYCKTWMKKNYGVFDRYKIPEAMNSYYKVVCRFCGKSIPYDPNTNLKMCELCKKIYRAAQREAEVRRRLGYKRKEV